LSYTPRGNAVGIVGVGSMHSRTKIQDQVIFSLRVLLGSPP